MFLASVASLSAIAVLCILDFWPEVRPETAGSSRSSAGLACSFRLEDGSRRKPGPRSGVPEVKEDEFLIEWVEGILSLPSLVPIRKELMQLQLQIHG